MSAVELCETRWHGMFYRTRLLSRRRAGCRDPRTQRRYKMNDQTDDKEWCEAFAQQLIGVEETLEGSRRQLALAVREGRHKRLGKTEAEFRRDLGVQVMRDREKRQAFTKTLTEEGFTQRQIAVAEGVDQKTVSRDQAEANASKNGQSAQESELALEANASKPDEAAPAEEPLTVGQVKAVQAMIEALKRRVQKQEARHGGKSITGEFMLDDLLLLGRWVEKCQPPFSAVLAPVLVKIGADLWAKWMSEEPSFDWTPEFIRLVAWIDTQEYKEFVARAPDSAFNFPQEDREVVARVSDSVFKRLFF
jgi:hypothetical protein